MEKEEQLFQKITEQLANKDKNVTLGRMMSSLGILYQEKVFAFYHDKEMIFKLGKDFDMKNVNVKNWKHLQPFKNKSPMTAWYVLPYSEKDKWKRLASIALENMRGKV